MISINKANLAVDIENGFKREDIIDKYSTETVKLNNSDVTRILQQTGLKIRKFRKPKFQIIDEPAVLPMETTDAIEIKETAEKGNIALVDFSGEFKLGNKEEENNKNNN